MRLKNYPLFETNDPDEANERLSRAFRSRTRVFSPKFSLGMRSVSLSRLIVTSTDSEAARETWIERNHSPYHWLIFHRRGGMRYRVDGGGFGDLGPGEGRLFSPGSDLACAMSGDSPIENIGIAIPTRYLREQAERIFGGPLKESFTPTGVFDAGSAAARMIGRMLNDLDRPDSDLARRTLTGQDAEQGLVAAIIRETPNNYRPLIERPPRDTVFERNVRRAERWMLAHLMESFTIADVAHAIGVSVRALEVAFGRYRGCRPGDFRRFMRAQYKLWEKTHNRS